MTAPSTPTKPRRFLPRAGLADLIGTLRADGYAVIGPTVVDGVICFRDIESADALPHGVKDVQAKGSYRLVEGDAELTFNFVLGPEGPKRYLFPPSQRLMCFRVEEDRFVLEAGAPEPPKLALVGVRPCELAAMQVSDRVFGRDDPQTFRCESEPSYVQARQQFLYIAVNCTAPGGTCFCASWGTGPQARSGFDLALTELREGFLIDVGSPRGQRLADGLPLREPSGAELELAELMMTRARERMGRSLATDGLKNLLDKHLEDPHWDAVAQRCLSCGNCTMVCPTCFCSTVSDATDLSGNLITRTRAWESCFTHQFSYTVTGPGRDSIRSRYRHWLRHKLCTWWDQFGVSGCVGCGRCITWCPVGIDLTKEVQKLRRSHPSTSAGGATPSPFDLASEEELP